MQFRTGFELVYSFPQPTPIILVVNVHESRAADLVVPDQLVTEPALPISGYRDGFGNRCNRIVAPAGRLRLTTDCVINDSGAPDERAFGAYEASVEELPEDLLVFLLGSRYCETDLLSNTAWQLFGGWAPGYSRVQAICDYVHNHIFFNYQNARATRRHMAFSTAAGRTGCAAAY
jgi:transglutaminase-like putative cysteine protease